MSDYQTPEFKSCDACGGENVTKASECAACTATDDDL
jgi:hypothetical protein